jgi:hypothetical protein
MLKIRIQTDATDSIGRQEGFIVSLNDEEQFLLLQDEIQKNNDNHLIKIINEHNRIYYIKNSSIKYIQILD